MTSGNVLSHCFTRRVGQDTWLFPLLSIKLLLYCAVVLYCMLYTLFLCALCSSACLPRQELDRFTDRVEMKRDAGPMGGYDNRMYRGICQKKNEEIQNFTKQSPYNVSSTGPEHKHHQNSLHPPRGTRENPKEKLRFTALYCRVGNQQVFFISTISFLRSPWAGTFRCCSLWENYSAHFPRHCCVL